MNQNNIQLDLRKYLDKESKIFSGRDLGKKVRKKIHLDKLDFDNNKYVFVFPDEIKYVADSFTLGLLGQSFIKLGNDRFLLKYSYITETLNSRYYEFINEDFRRGISYIKNYSKNIL